MRQVRVRRWLVVTVLCAMVALPSGAWVIASTTNANRALIRAIQAERIRNIRQNCEDTNTRHDATIRQLHLLVEELPPGPRKGAGGAGDGRQHRLDRFARSPPELQGACRPASQHAVDSAAPA
jgi:hypothetical protein